MVAVRRRLAGRGRRAGPALLHALGRLEHDGDGHVLRRPEPRRRAAGRSARRARRDRARAGPARHLAGLGGRRGPARAARRLPARLRQALRRVRLLDDVGLYGHFGQGCMHTRIDFDLTTAEGVATTGAFIERGGRPGRSYGGSLSGEHGDGQARGELLPKMFGRASCARSASSRRSWTRTGPDEPGQGRGARPRSTRTCGSAADWSPRAGRDVLQVPRRPPLFAPAATRCVGVGKCRTGPQRRHVMCPVYQVDDGRGALDPRPRPACCSRCSAGTATRRSRMAGGRPRSATRSTCAWRARDASGLPGQRRHGDLQGGVPRPPLQGAAAAPVPLRARLAAHDRGAVRRLRLVTATNALARVRASHGWRQRRGASHPATSPLFAPVSLQQWFSGTDGRRTAGRGARCCCGLTRSPTSFHPEVGMAAVEVLEHAGWEVRLSPPGLCCGLTWLSTGQLGRRPADAAAHDRSARRTSYARRTRRRPRAELHGGIPLGRRGAPGWRSRRRASKAGRP